MEADYYLFVYVQVYINYVIRAPTMYIYRSILDVITCLILNDCIFYNHLMRGCILS